MSEFMRPISFKHLIEWSLEEFKNQETIFGIHKDKFYRNTSGNYLKTVFGDEIASAVGPAAGPHSQLAQNIIASYLTGSRFIEVKTVQIMDGEQIQQAIGRPCIWAEDECYNCEWSTELTVQEAFNEYTKAYFAIQVLAKELGISDKKDFMYNMSVGYDLEGIKSEKVDNYIEGLKNASNTEIFKECKEYLKENIGQFKTFTVDDVEKISPEICHSITLSTLHGCPAVEIESIANYLLTEKKLNTFIKCNPTLLGYDFARNTLDEMGFDYIAFTDFHFKDDLQYADAIEMFKRLQKLAKSENKAFGLKLTNTFPVDVKRNELPSEEMYMSGRSLYPLTVSLAAKLSKEFDGKLPMSYSGGADALNIRDLLKTGVQPITMATTILKPGGYPRFKQIAEASEDLLSKEYRDIDVEYITRYAKEVVENPQNNKLYREKVKSRKTESELPLIDCFKAPCKDGGCPINQQIPEYLKLVAEERYDEAMKVIANDNTAPTILGTICAHHCQTHCTRVDYEKSLQIKDIKLIAANNAQDKFIEEIKKVDIKSDKKVAVIGAGPVGIAAASYLRRNGVDVVVFEKLSKPYGIVSHIIPEFRISDEMIERDFRIAEAQGVEFKFNTEVTQSYEELKKDYDYVIVATGAWEKGTSPVKEGTENITDALDFLWKMRMEDGFELGKKVAVVGAGDVAMDCVRLAHKQGVEAVLVYRRTEAYMPATQEEVEEVKESGIQIMELTAPVKYDGKTLTCEKMMLGDFDASGRKSVVGTGEFIDLEFDTVIGATGAKVNLAPFKENGINMDDRGRMKLLPTLESNIENVYIIGDCKEGPSTIVKGMGDAKTVALDILKKEGLDNDFERFIVPEKDKVVYEKRGILENILEGNKEGNRCLKCDQICEVCTEVCPNRANVAINLEGYENKHQIVHIDGMCNECGNCAVFCPHAGKPYKDKITLFWTKEDFEDSTNVGFLRTGENTFLVRAENGNIIEHELGDGKISDNLENFIKGLLKEYGYYFEPTVC
ncbi:putative selenate reductase subunit YgfK [Peptoniphilus indolicus]|uniref:Pyridine nucleotide-disulfide family oxidoreductase n=2 Tax=Peptoniphilus indolicus TaxID=33030 RepID=G4D3P9_9FIRM|nr:putative selenate reductase subunit YgfK [Peptoniphilus indolicus]EGY79847.1 pyridine nucleotide-disulfide family oxidoreductase [Peptoniphilus indolicus ATCC 29427]SUB75724.1 Glutamate synthase [NADPH] small chain [Peptoniphilus indolicus]